MIHERRSRLVVLATALVVAGVFGGAFLVGRSSSTGEVALADPDPAAPPPSVTATITLEEPTSRPTPPPGGVGQVNPPGPDVMPDPNATPDITQSWWFVPYTNHDAKQPIETLTLNGITVGPDVEREQVGCDGEAAVAGLEAVSDSRVGIPLAALPIDGIIAIPETTAVTCDGEAIIAEAQLGLPPESSISAFGGTLVVVRWLGEPRETIWIPAHRWSEGTVAGLPAAIAEPILPDLGFGESAVLVYSEGVVTKVHADGVPLDELLAIAEEVVR